MNKFLLIGAVLLSLLALPQPAVGQAADFVDTAYIREQINKYESAGSDDLWDVDDEVQTRRLYLSDLMRAEYQGSQRSGLISEQAFAEMEKGIPYTGFTPLTEMGPGDTYKQRPGWGALWFREQQPTAGASTSGFGSGLQNHPSG